MNEDERCVLRHRHDNKDILVQKNNANNAMSWNCVDEHERSSLISDY